MRIYKPIKGTVLYYLLGILAFYDILIILGIAFVNSYILSTLFKLVLGIFTVYQLYYILLCFSLKYGLDDENIYILGLFKNIKIPLNEVEGYKFESGKINGVRLSGFGTNNFAIGKTVIKKIGTTNTYITSNRKILYLKAGDTIYALSPTEYDNYENFLISKGIKPAQWEYKWDKNINLHKDKCFMRPFIAVSVIIVILTLNPFILYLMDKLPSKMPLNFDSSFMPLEYGTGKQFAFNQMMYGAMNMTILFCMYYASYFYAKYDRKSCNKFIYYSLIIAAAFLLIQIRILHTFK